MCGVYGFIGVPKNKGKALNLLNRLMINTEVRGIHSTGYCAITNDEIVLEKLEVRARDFWKVCSLPKVVKKEGAYIVMGHNRWASVGKICYENAHPFEGDRFVLTHNGTCSSAVDMVDKMEDLSNKMEGTTDSEAILRLLEWIGSMEDANKLLETLDDFSLVILDKETETIYFARSDAKPLYVADLRNELGIRVWASTVEIMAKSLTEAGFDIGKVHGFATKAGTVYKVSLEDNLEVNKQGQFSQKPRTVIRAVPMFTEEPDNEEDRTLVEGDQYAGSEAYANYGGWEDGL